MERKLVICRSRVHAGLSNRTIEPAWILRHYFTPTACPRNRFDSLLEASCRRRTLNLLNDAALTSALGSRTVLKMTASKCSRDGDSARIRSICQPSPNDPPSYPTAPRLPALFSCPPTAAWLPTLSLCVPPLKSRGGGLVFNRRERRGHSS